MNDSLFSVKGKVVIITGGGQGIGEFLALGLSKSGATVYCIDKKLKKTKKNNAITINLALNYGSKEEIIDACKKFVFEKNKKIDIQNFQKRLSHR